MDIRRFRPNLGISIILLKCLPRDIGVLPSQDNTKCFFPLALELVLVITVEHHHQDDGNDHHTEDG